MEYSPNCAIPYVSRVDAGTIELVRALGVDVVSSGDLIQQFEARWNDAAIATHRRASEKLYRIKDQAFELIARRLARRRRHHRVRHSAADGRLVQGRRTDCRFGAMRLRARERRQPALPRDGDYASRDSEGRARAARPVGQAGYSPARFTRTSLGWDLPAAGARTHGQGFCRDLRRARCRRRHGPKRGARGPRGPGIRSRQGGAPGA